MPQAEDDFDEQKSPLAAPAPKEAEKEEGRLLFVAYTRVYAGVLRPGMKVNIPFAAHCFAHPLDLKMHTLPNLTFSFRPPAPCSGAQV